MARAGLRNTFLFVQVYGGLRGGDLWVTLCDVWGTVCYSWCHHPAYQCPRERCRLLLWDQAHSHAVENGDGLSHRERQSHSNRSGFRRVEWRVVLGTKAWESFWFPAALSALHLLENRTEMENISVLVIYSNGLIYSSEWRENPHHSYHNSEKIEIIKATTSFFFTIFHHTVELVF